MTQRGQEGGDQAAGISDLFNGPRNCLVLSLRHLGDAVIGSGFINALRRRNPELAVDVLGRKGLEEVIRTFGSFREYIDVEFPVFGHHRKDPTTFAAAMRTLHAVRRRKYDYCFNLIGDTRENLIGFLSGARWNVAPVWERRHLFKKKMTDTGAAIFVNGGIGIPSIYPSFYGSMQFFSHELGLSGLDWRFPPPRRKGFGERLSIALHPGASHPSRHWPDAKWRELIRALHLHGYDIRILGAQVENGALRDIFGSEIVNCGAEIVTGDIAHFAATLAAADVLIGMDSFSVHAAYALKVPTVVLNGSADPLILTPPGGVVVGAGHLCSQFPCYYKYPCRGTAGEYICVRGTEVSAVLNALDEVLRRNGSDIASVNL